MAFAEAEVLDIWVENIPHIDESIMACACQEVSTVTKLGCEDVTLVSLKLNVWRHKSLNACVLKLINLLELSRECIFDRIWYGVKLHW